MTFISTYFTILQLIRLALHCQAGGVLDPAANLKISDFTGADGAKKVLGAMGGIVAPTKKKGREKDTEKQPKEAVEGVPIVFQIWVTSVWFTIDGFHPVSKALQVAEESPLSKAQALLNKVFKELNHCRSHVLFYVVYIR